MPQPTTTSSHSILPFLSMPTKATKNWGQASKDLLNNLINKQLVNITNTTYQNIEQVRLAQFLHSDPKNFCVTSAIFWRCGTLKSRLRFPAGILRNPVIPFFKLLERNCDSAPTGKLPGAQAKKRSVWSSVEINVGYKTSTYLIFALISARYYSTS